MFIQSISTLGFKTWGVKYKKQNHLRAVQVDYLEFRKHNKPRRWRNRAGQGDILDTVTPKQLTVWSPPANGRQRTVKKSELSTRDRRD